LLSVITVTTDMAACQAQIDGYVASIQSTPGQYPAIACYAGFTTDASQMDAATVCAALNGKNAARCEEQSRFYFFAYSYEAPMAPSVSLWSSA
jgi:hypothetical protein